MSGHIPAHNNPDELFRTITVRQLDVLRVIREQGIVTRADIALQLQASASQVSRLTAPLIARTLVTVESRVVQTEGRPTEVLALADDTYYVAGLDIGGLAQDAVITNLRGDVVGSAHAMGQLPDSRSAIVHHLSELIQRAVTDAEIRVESVLGAGVGVRAIVDPVSGIVAAGPETPSWSPLWAEFDLRAELATALPWKRLVIDDTVRALAAAERRYGAATGFDDFVYLLADSGIGATLTIDGHPYIGPGHLAGEAGHITLDPDGPRCGCGRRGCVECYASTSAMIERGQAFDAGIVTIEQMIERADDGDARMHQILADGGSALGRAIGMMLNLLSPALIVIGGAAVDSAIYLDHARKTAKAESLHQAFRAARIIASDIRISAGARGAATLILDELFSLPVMRMTHDMSAHRRGVLPDRSRAGGRE